MKPTFLATPADLRANRAAQAFFSKQDPGMRAATHWVISAKREETRQRRQDQLIADSAAGRTVPPLTRDQPAKRKSKRAPAKRTGRSRRPSAPTSRSSSRR